MNSVYSGLLRVPFPLWRDGQCVMIELCIPANLTPEELERIVDFMRVWVMPNEVKS